MVRDPTIWCRSHRNAVKNYLKSNLISSPNNLPQLPRDPLKWIEVARPTVEGKPRTFLVAPFWVPIYQDDSSLMMVVGGRQIFKSTTSTDFLAYEATTNPGSQICYVTFDENNLVGFSRKRLLDGTFRQNPILSQFLKRGTGGVHEISLKNYSTIFLTTDQDKFRHVEGKSPVLVILDESQHQDLQFFGRIRHTLMATMGKIKIFGTGGEAGSPYHRIWNETNQMEWQYDDPNWRDYLQFDQKGLVIGNYLLKVLKGQWIATRPDIEFAHGYHISREMFATQPLTEQDAVNKYNRPPSYSLESIKKTEPPSVYTAQVLGQFFRSFRRPITPQMVYACMEPYRYLSYLAPSDTIQLKNIFGEKIKIVMGVDFGSGLNSSATAIAVLIHWKDPDRLQLAWLEKRPRENQLMQAKYICELFKQYGCDYGVGDLGYGVNQIKLIQDGGHHPENGFPYNGVTDSKFVGCRTISDETKPIQFFADKIDEHGEQVARLHIDKTSSIETLIQTLEKSLYHPLYKSDQNSRKQLMIPFTQNAESLVNDLTSITRKNLESDGVETIEDRRQRARKEYNHPPDTAMAIIYAIMGTKYSTEWHWASA